MQKRMSWLPIFLSYFILSSLLIILSFGSRLPFIYGFSEIVLHPLRASSYTLFASARSGEDALKAENTKLRLQLAKMLEMQKDEAALRDQFQTTTLTPTRLLPSQILSARTFIPGVSSPEGIVIDRGTQDGLVKGLAVVSKDNLIGIIDSVSPHASHVVLLTSATASLTGVTVKTNAVGILRGHGRGGMTYENVLLSEELEAGDMVTTKGDTNTAGVGIPPNLIIGKISTVHKRSSSLFQNAELASLIDITKLTTVFVVAGR